MVLVWFSCDLGWFWCASGFCGSGFRDTVRLGMIGVFVWLCDTGLVLSAIWDLSGGWFWSLGCYGLTLGECGGCCVLEFR